MFKLLKRKYHTWHLNKMLSDSNSDFIELLKIASQLYTVADMSTYHAGKARLKDVTMWNKSPIGLVNVIKKFIQCIDDDNVIPSSTLPHNPTYKGSFDMWMTDDEGYEIDIAWVWNNLESDFLVLANVLQAKRDNRNPQYDYYQRKLIPVKADVRTLMRVLLTLI